MSKNKNPDPFLTLHLRVFIQTGIYGWGCALALAFWHWIFSEEEGLGIEGIAELTGLGVTKVKDTMKILYDKKLVEKSRSFGGKTRWILIAKKMTFLEALEILVKRSPNGLLAASELVASRLSISRQTAKCEPPDGSPNIKEKERAETKEKEEGAIAPADPQALTHKQALGIFKKLWEASHPGRKYSFTGKDHGNLKTLLKNEFMPEYFEAKVMGYLADKDGFNLGQAHSLSLCCSQFNKWKALDEPMSNKPSTGGLA